MNGWMLVGFVLFLEMQGTWASSDILRFGAESDWRLIFLLGKYIANVKLYITI
jgi:hypothetical protein